MDQIRNSHLHLAAVSLLTLRLSSALVLMSRNGHVRVAVSASNSVHLRHGSLLRLNSVGDLAEAALLRGHGRLHLMHSGVLLLRRTHKIIKHDLMAKLVGIASVLDEVLECCLVCCRCSTDSFALRVE